MGGGTNTIVDERVRKTATMHRANGRRGRLLLLPGGRAYDDSTTHQRRANPLSMADPTDNAEAHMMPIAGRSKNS